jgi:DNA-binding MarR family transcriptional regulator
MGSHAIVAGASKRVKVPSTRGILDDLRRIVRVLRTGATALEARHGVTAAQLFALQAVGRHPGTSLRDLAVLTHTDQSSVSTLVQRLEARGLVRRRRSSVDARRVELEPSPKGRALLARAPDAPQERVVTAISKLDGATRQNLARGLDGLVRAMGAEKELATLFFEGSPAKAARGKSGRATNSARASRARVSR